MGRGAHVNEGRIGGIMLYLAVDKNRADEVRILLTNKADLQIRNSRGEIALDTMRRCSSDDAEELLESSMREQKRPKKG